jgi:single-stranded DNA-specific DHH superfamily exonuclease
MLEDLQGKGLLIHHWDTDGICSAKLLLNKLSNREMVNKTPELGNYFLTEKEKEEYSRFDFIIIADMSLPEKDVQTLSNNVKVLIFDHHLGKEIKEIFHHNPVIKGKNPDLYPSASWIVNEYLKNKINLFSILGIVGDHEKKIQNNSYFNELITSFCTKNKIKFEDLLKMVYLIDSNYKIGDKNEVEKAPNFLLDHEEIKDILHHKKWNNNLDTLNKEMATQLAIGNDEINGIIVKKIHTNYNIISAITRKVAWESGKNTIVINTGFFNDKNQLYVRSSKNLESMIQRGKTLGFKCGGKKEVLGAIIPNNKTDSFVEEILDFLK